MKRERERARAQRFLAEIYGRLRAEGEKMKTHALLVDRATGSTQHLFVGNKTSDEAHEIACKWVAETGINNRTIRQITDGLNVRWVLIFV